MSNFKRNVIRAGARRKKKSDNLWNRFLTNWARFGALLNMKSEDAKAEYERGYDDGWMECEQEAKENAERERSNVVVPEMAKTSE